MPRLGRDPAHAQAQGRSSRPRVSASHGGMKTAFPSSALDAVARVRAMRESSRMKSVQSPIIPVVAELIRQHPGTISLGQGVVNYGPPPEAAAQIARFLTDPENHKYKPVVGLPEML